MSQSHRAVMGVGALLFVLALLPSHVHPEAQVDQESEKLSWDSPKMREVESEWQSLFDTSNQTPEKIPGQHKSSEVAVLQNRLLDKHLSNSELQQLARVPGPVPESDFIADVVDLMVASFVLMGD